MIEAPAPAPVAEEAPAEKEGKEEGEEIFKIHQPEFVSKINVIGQIDLAALNQSTRPKKKSKEEKRKEREEKEKIRQDQKKQMKEAIIKEIRRDDSKLKDTAAGDANGKRNVSVSIRRKWTSTMLPTSSVVATIVDTQVPSKVRGAARKVETSLVETMPIITATAIRTASRSRSSSRRLARKM